MLTYAGMWWADDHRFVSWTPESVVTIREAKRAMEFARVPLVSRYCAHVRGHGGVKRSVLFVHARMPQLPFIARFDVRSYYETIDHGVLLAIVQDAGVPRDIAAVIQQYLTVPDVDNTGRGMVAGGSLSPLLSAIYLGPLDEAMDQLRSGGGIDYIRYADDIAILARTRHLLRKAIARMHAVLYDLRLQVHPGKRFIGRAERGFEFLGFFIHPRRRLVPSSVSMQRLVERSRRLHEQGASQQRLRRYVHNWYMWFARGLGHLAGRNGGETRYWVYVIRHLNIAYPVHPPP